MTSRTSEVTYSDILKYALHRSYFHLVPKRMLLF